MGLFTERGTEAGPNVSFHRMFGLEVCPTAVFAAKRFGGFHCKQPCSCVDLASNYEIIWPSIWAGLRQKIGRVGTKSGHMGTKLRGKRTIS